MGNGSACPWKNEVGDQKQTIFSCWFLIQHIFLSTIWIYLERNSAFKLRPKGRVIWPFEKFKNPSKKVHKISDACIFVRILIRHLLEFCKEERQIVVRCQPSTQFQRLQLLNRKRKNPFWLNSLWIESDNFEYSSLTSLFSLAFLSKKNWMEKFYGLQWQQPPSGIDACIQLSFESLWE